MSYNEDPGLCWCGHFRYLHLDRPCFGWSRKKYGSLRLPFGFHIQISRLCQCKGARR